MPIGGLRDERRAKRAKSARKRRQRKAEERVHRKTTRKKPRPCWCSAYHFPHRPGSERGKVAKDADAEAAYWAQHTGDVLPF